MRRSISDCLKPSQPASGVAKALAILKDSGHGLPAASGSHGGGLCACRCTALREADPAEHGAVEHDQFGDGSVGDPQDVERERESALVAGAPDVIRDGRLAVDSRDHAAQRAERLGAEAALDAQSTTLSRPSHTPGWGGIENRTSSLSRRLRPAWSGVSLNAM